MFLNVSNNMQSHRYILQPYKGINTRYHCPACNHRDKTFVRYIDTQNNEQVNDVVGRCNRESSCGYHLTPKQFFQQHNIQPVKITIKHSSQPLQHPKPTSYISQTAFQQSLSNYESNNFVQFLISTFGITTTQQVLNKYFIGTSKHWQGATIFWQLDAQGKIRTGKIMLYNPNTGKRVKQPYNHITWVHTLLKNDNYNLNQCLFGEHLLKYNTKPIAIVESEKTALIASIYLPQYCWLAVGSLSNLTALKCNVLKGLNVVLFPDLNAYDNWLLKANELRTITNFQVSNLLEANATMNDKKQGFDLADYLLQTPLQQFQNTTNEILATTAFEWWLSNNPDGGIFSFQFQKFLIKVK